MVPRRVKEGNIEEAIRSGKDIGEVNFESGTAHVQKDPWLKLWGSGLKISFKNPLVSPRWLCGAMVMRILPSPRTSLYRKACSLITSCHPSFLGPSQIFKR